MATASLKRIFIGDMALADTAARMAKRSRMMIGAVPRLAKIWWVLVKGDVPAMRRLRRPYLAERVVGASIDHLRHDMTAMAGHRAAAFPAPLVELLCGQPSTEIGVRRNRDVAERVGCQCFRLQFKTVCCIAPVSSVSGSS